MVHTLFKAVAAQCFEEALSTVPIRIPSLWLSVDRFSITLSPWSRNQTGLPAQMVKQKSACSLILSNLRVPHSPAADYSKVLLPKGQELVSFLVGMQVGTLLVIQHLRVWEMT